MILKKKQRRRKEVVQRFSSKEETPRLDSLQIIMT
jgi:hypothetical protein